MKRSLPLLIFWTLLFSAGCQRNLPPGPPSDFGKDAALETRVRALLAAERTLQDEPIEVRVERGAVLLTGRVDRQEQKEKATEVASRAGGELPIRNEIVVEG